MDGKHPLHHGIYDADKMFYSLAEILNLHSKHKSTIVLSLSLSEGQHRLHNCWVVAMARKIKTSSVLHLDNAKS